MHWRSHCSAPALIRSTHAASDVDSSYCRRPERTTAIAPSWLHRIGALPPIRGVLPDSKRRTMPPRDVICEGSDMNFKYTSSAQRLFQAPAAPVVFVVDGDEGARNELEALIRSTGWEARTAASAEEFLAQERATTPSCLLVELQLPGSSGLDLQRLVADRADLPVIFMTSRADIQATVQAMKGGAFEF